LAVWVLVSTGIWIVVKGFGFGVFVSFRAVMPGGVSVFGLWVGCGDRER
jgi:hypothetical protein